jgi:hypothetical protein
MRTILALAILLFSPAAVAAQERGTELPVDRAHWALSGDARIESYLGRPALRMRFGSAEAAGVSFQDGTLEFDLAVGTHRNFPFVDLRKIGEGEFEEFYFRTHKSELPDAIQYVPTWHGVGGWQLYHGPGFTAPVAFPRHEWFHVRIVLSGPKAAVFVGETDQPQLIVTRLRREPKAGGLAFEAIAPGTPPDGEFTTNISNVVIRPGVVPFDFSKVRDEEPSPPGVVTRWDVSGLFVAKAIQVHSLAEAGDRVTWTRVEAEPSGLLVLDRWVARAPQGQWSAALARVVVTSTEAGTRAFHFGYSDEVTVFLNGVPLFTGDAHYSFDNPRQEGLIGLTQGTVYLPLHTGRNELVLAVSDVFGGWGVMGRFENMLGLTVTTEESAGGR